MEGKIHTIVSPDGLLEDPSHLSSWLFYRELTDNFKGIQERENGKLITKKKWLDSIGAKHCPVHYGVGRPFIVPDVGLVMCICDLFDEEIEYNNVINRIGSTYRKGKTLDQLSTDGLSKTQGQTLRGIVKAWKLWAEHPKKWVIMYGNPGCGKTHIMESLAEMLYPMAMYVKSDDFTDKIFDYTGNKEFGVNTLISEYARHPILLYDDWGLGHDPQYTLGKLESVLNKRYKDPDELPVVISTNMNRQEMYHLDFRITSRLFEVATWVDMSSLPDYRTVLK